MDNSAFYAENTFMLLLFLVSASLVVAGELSHGIYLPFCEEETV